MTEPPARHRPRSTGRVTLAEVARAAGVSPITVSRALRGDRNVHAELVERVREAADRLAYVPDPAAQTLASAHSRHVAVLVPLLSNRLFGDLLESAQQVLQHAGYQMLFGVTHYDPLEEEGLLRSHLAHRPAGLILTGFDRTVASRSLLAASRVPCVHVMETAHADGTYCVGFSQVDAGHAVTRHLIARGRRRIAYAAAQLDTRVMQRAQGYRSGLREAGLYDPALELLDPQPSSMALGGRMFDDLIARHPDLDAIFFCNDDLAQGALLAALRRGVPVPRQVAICGFNDLEGSDQMLPALTTVRTPRAAMGAEAARMLLALIAGEPVPVHSLDLGYELVLRESS